MTRGLSNHNVRLYVLYNNILCNISDPFYHLVARIRGSVNRLNSIRLLILRVNPSGDNPAMTKERDLLGWIIGGLSVAGVAVAITAVSIRNRAAPIVQPPRVIAAAAAPAPAPAVVAPTADPKAPPAAAAQLADQATAKADVQPGQIWECMTNGVKTFSNNPCGEKSALLEITPINTMNPTPQVRYAGGYPAPPRYASAYNEPNAAYAQDENADDEGSETGGNSYTLVQGVGFVPRRRQGHPHRPPNHPSSGPMPRKF